MKRMTLISLGQTGAGPVYSLEMARALAASGKCRLQIIISDGVTNLNAWKDAFQDKEVEFHIVKAYQHTRLSVFLSFFNYYRKLRIVKLIGQFCPDVLYVPFGLLWSRFIYGSLSKNIKIIRTVHDVEAHDRFNISEIISDILTFGSNKYVDGFVILNQKDKTQMVKKYHKPVAVIPHASFSYYFKNKTDASNLTRTIGFFGRIEPYKGLDLLIDAFERTETVGLKLLVAGSGTIDEELQNRIEQAPNITLINRYIKDEEFQPLLDQCDFVVLPYKRASQSGVIPMCFAYGKTVIATNVGALSEQVPDGTGVITEPDSNQIAEEIDRLYSNPELIFEYGKAASIYAEKELSWEHSADLLINFVKTLLK